MAKSGKPPREGERRRTTRAEHTVGAHGDEAEFFGASVCPRWPVAITSKARTNAMGARVRVLRQLEEAADVGNGTLVRVAVVALDEVSMPCEFGERLLSK